MGVPGLFRDLIRTTPLCQAKQSETRFAHLLFDYNSLMYHALRNVRSASSDAEPGSDDAVIPHIIRYTNHWIRAIDPSRSVYVAIDGPVPMAKMACQRRRRFKRVVEETYRSHVANRYRNPEPPSFETTKFTPGTVFMEKFVARLVPFVRVAGTTRVVMSDHHVAGEGEHKLMRYLRRLPPSEPVCIYGLDADLIVLSLLSDHPNLYLARDAEEETQMLSIEACRKALFERVVEALQKTDPKGRWRTRVRVDRIIVDLCFLMSVGGNDFVPGLFAWTMRSVGMDPWIEVYARVVGPRVDGNRGYLVDDTRRVIDWDLWRRIIDRMADGEAAAVRTALRKLMRPDGRRREDDADRSPIERAMADFNHRSYATASNPFHKPAMADLSTMVWKTSLSEWSRRYEARYDLDRRSACVEYVNAIDFAWRYYLDHHPPCWDYVYPFEAAPLAHWFGETGVERPEFVATRTVPYPPIVQLAYVIPPKQYGLLPRTLRVPRADARLTLDYMGGKYIYAEPRMDMSGVARIEETVRAWLANEDVSDSRDARRNRVFSRDRIVRR